MCEKGLRGGARFCSLLTDEHIRFGCRSLLGFLTAVGPLSTDMYLPAFPSIEASFGTAPGTAQITLATWFLGLAVGQMTQGTLADRFGRRWPLLIGTGHLHARLGRLRALAQSGWPLGLARDRRVRRLGEHGHPARRGARPGGRACGGAADVAADAGDGRGADPRADARRLQCSASPTGT